MKSLYDFPEVYDAVLQRSGAVVDAEVATIHRLLAEQNVSQARILELACGTCAHSIRLAQKGHNVTGIDRSIAMLAGAKGQAEQADVTISLVQGDVIDFTIHGPRFDCVLFMYETFPVITAYDDLVRHFDCVRRHIKDGGLYIIDFGSRPAKEGAGSLYHEREHQVVPFSRGSIEVWAEEFPGDWIDGVYHLIYRCRATIDNAIHDIAEEWRLRVYSPWVLSLLTKTLQGWTLKGFFVPGDLNPDITQAENYFMILEANPMQQQL